MTFRTKSVLIVLMFAAAAVVNAQEPAAAGGRQGRGGRGGRAGGPPQAPAPAPLFFKEEWKAGAQAAPVTQSVVANADLLVAVYGKTPNEPEVNEEGGVNHVWTGLCAPSCAVTLKNKNSFADLTGKAHMKWYAKVSGFHQIRPVVKLADGTWLVGDHATGPSLDFNQEDVSIADMHWLKLDIARVVAVGNWIDHPDLSKVDEVGFADLMPGSGHGPGGYVNVGKIEVFGRPVKR